MIIILLSIALAQYFAEDKPYYYTYSQLTAFIKSQPPYQNLNEFSYPCKKVQCSTSGTKCLMIGPEEAENSTTKTDLQDDDKEDVILLDSTACGIIFIRR